MSAIIDPHFKVANGLVDNDLKSAGRNDGRHMKIMAFFLLLVTPLSFAITGCISSSNPPPPPSSTTVVVPNGTTVICSNGTEPPCR